MTILRAFKEYDLDTRRSGPRSHVQSERMRLQWENPNSRQKMIKSMKEQRGTGESRQKMSDRAKNQWKTMGEKMKDAVSKSIRALWRDDNFRQEQSEKTKRQWESEAFQELQREKGSKQAQAMWSDPDFRCMMEDMWKSEEFRERSSMLMRENWESEEFRENHAKTSSEQFKRLWQNPEFQQMQAEMRARLQSGAPTSIEVSIASSLDRIGMAYKSQVPIGRWTCDFVLSDYPIVIECDGDYWHSLPGVPSRDAQKDRDLERLGYTVLRLPENKIKKDLEWCIGVILDAIG